MAWWRRQDPLRMPVNLTLRACTRIVATGYHCAFPSLTQWRGHTYLAYREAQHHQPAAPGRVVLQRSADLATWEPVVTLATGGDDRDPRLLATTDALWCAWGTYVPHWQREGSSYATMKYDLLSHVSQTRDGHAWQAPLQVLRPGYWLWSVLEAPVTAHGKETLRAWGAAYHFGDGLSDVDHSIHLWFSDGLGWWRHWVTMLDVGEPWARYGPAEPALCVPGPGRLACVVRLEGEPALLGRAAYPYLAWTWRALPCEVHAPALARVPGLGWVLAGRRKLEGDARTRRRGDAGTGGDSGVGSRRRVPASGFVPASPLAPPATYDTALWALDVEAASLRLLLALPSGGDCSYPGLVWDEARQELLCCYYSQHERPATQTGWPVAADIYLARLGVEEPRSTS